MISKEAVPDIDEASRVQPARVDEVGGGGSRKRERRLKR